VTEFFKDANPEDQASLMEFSGHPELVSPLPHNLEEIQNRLMSTQSKGHMALASYLALQAAKKATNPRKALLVISGGGDSSSRYTEEEVKHLVKETDVRTYMRYQYAFGCTPSRQARDWKF
jgi:Ca-activated chloride channel family protein